MTGSTDALSSGFKQPVGNVARISPANGLSVCVDCFGKLDRVAYRLVEQRMQELNYELQRGFLIVVKD